MASWIATYSSLALRFLLHPTRHVSSTQQRYRVTYFHITMRMYNRMQNGLTKDQPLINLLRGWPNPSLLPVAQIKAAAAAALSQPDISTAGLLYGPDPGYEPLRDAIANWLSNFYQLTTPINLNRICITGGASQNLACILQVFSDPLYTRFVWQVSPTYFRVCPIFEDNAFHGRLRSVPEDDEGIDVEFLRRQLQQLEEDSSTNGQDKRVRQASVDSEYRLIEPTRTSKALSHGERSIVTSYMLSPPFPIRHPEP